MLFTILWIVIALVTLFIEVNTFQFVSIWFCVAAFITAICAACGCSFTVQIVVFASTSVVLIVLTRPFVKKITKKTKKIDVTSDGLVGETVTVIEDVSVDKVGLVQAKYEKYNAYTVDGTILKGEKAVVESLRGNKLIIKKMEE